MTILKYANGVVFRKEPAGGILFNVDTGDIQVVEGVAFGICDLIDRGNTLEKILENLKELYPEEINLETDLNDFVRDMRKKGVLD